MKEPTDFDDIVPGRLSAAELKVMALRQQQQIDSQHQLLTAKEQRLRFLKTQEMFGTAAVAEGERLRRLCERVEAQEFKLRRLRALRGQVDLQKSYNATLSNDLDSIRALFNEKEKELSLAVAKVETLTKQLEDLKQDRRGTINYLQNNENSQQIMLPVSKELDKLRRELMQRNQISIQQDARLHLQREALQQRQAELRSVDQRIIELQIRLQKRKASNLLLKNNQQNSLLCITAQHQPQMQYQQQQQQHEIQQQKHHAKQIHPQKMKKNQIVFSKRQQRKEEYNQVKKPFHNSKISLSKNTQNSNNCENNYQQQKSANISHNLKMTSNAYAPHKMVLKSNIAAVEPYVHTPHVVPPTFPYINATNMLNQPVLPTNNQLKDITDFKLNLSNMKATSPFGKNEETISARQNIDEKLNMNQFQQSITDNMNANEENNSTMQVSPSNSSSSKFSNESDLEKPNVFSMTNSSKPLENNRDEKESHETKIQHQTTSGNLVEATKKPISSVAPTTITHTSAIPKIVAQSPKVNKVSPNIISTKLAENFDQFITRPALPPKPNKSHSAQQSGDNSSNIMPPTVVSVINKTMISELQKTESSNLLYFSSANPDNLPIKAKPLTIRKQPLSEQPKLKSHTSGIKSMQYQTRRKEMPAILLLKEAEKTDMKDENKNSVSPKSSISKTDEVDKAIDTSTHNTEEKLSDDVVERVRSSSVSTGKNKASRRVSFDPLALLLDASLEGELELVKKTAMQVTNPSAANDEGITALHNAICAGHIDIVKFLVEFGCDVNAQDSDGWTPLHCAASCNNLSMVKFLVENGACLFAVTLSDHETPAEKCEEDEEGFDGCSEYLYSIQEKLGILNNGEVCAVFSYEAQQLDELSFLVNEKLTILRKGDDAEREWWWAKNINGLEGYVPRNLLGLYPRVPQQSSNSNE